MAKRAEFFCGFTGIKRPADSSRLAGALAITKKTNFCDYFSFFRDRLQILQRRFRYRSGRSTAFELSHQTLADLMCANLDCQSSESRDMLFAFLGVAPEVYMSMNLPDYTLVLSEIVLRLLCTSCGILSDTLSVWTELRENDGTCEIRSLYIKKETMQLEKNFFLAPYGSQVWQTGSCASQSRSNV